MTSTKNQTHEQNKPTTTQHSSQPDPKETVTPAPETHPSPILQRAERDPHSLTPSDIWQLQRTIGNQRTGQILAQASPPKPTARETPPLSFPISLQRMLANRGLQTKLTVNAPHDQYEQEANTITQQVVNIHTQAAPQLQRQPGTPNRSPKRVSHTGEVIQREKVNVTDSQQNIWTVRYNAKPKPDKYIVYLPSGFPPDAKSEIETALNKKPDEITYTNEKGDDITIKKSGQQDFKTAQGSETAKVTKAKQMVTDTLTKVGFMDNEIGKLLEAQTVEFLDESMWQFLYGTQFGFNNTMYAKSTEGITTSQKPKGERKVGINKSNYTLPAIVHELFHSVEHPHLSQLTNNTVEGMTEYWTHVATGIDIRTDKAATGVVYKEPVQKVKQAIAQKVISQNDLGQAYFGGNLNSIQAFISWEKQEK